MARKAIAPTAVARIAAASTPSLASSSCRPLNAMLATSSETVNPIPVTVLPARRTGQVTAGWAARNTGRLPTHTPIWSPIGLPTT